MSRFPPEAREGRTPPRRRRRSGCEKERPGSIRAAREPKRDQVAENRLKALKVKENLPLKGRGGEEGRKKRRGKEGREKRKGREKEGGMKGREMEGREGWRTGVAKGRK